MNKDESKTVIPVEIIETKIFLIRGQRVMLDKDLTDLYSVSTSIMNKAVSRNIDRFPSDFMFQLTYQEVANLKFHIGTSSWGGTRKLPRAFTEQGVAMLSSILRSNRAAQVNIEIMRTFVKLRQMLATNADLARKLEQLEKKYDSQLKIVFDAIKAPMTEPEKPQKKIGFVVKEKQAKYGAKRKK